MQFLPAANRQLPWAVSAEGYGQFLIDVLFDEWVRHDVGEIYDLPRRFAFSLDKRETLPAGCRSCRYCFCCFGECPEHRVDGKNALCEGLKAYFEHVEPAMDIMKGLLAQQRAPAEIMTILDNRQYD